MVKVNFLETQKKHLFDKTKTIFVFLLITSLAISPISPAVANDELPYPAPTLLSPTDKSSSAVTQPLITGLSLNDSLIKIFIDDQLNGQFQVKNHASGTANFAYEPFLNLKPGWHKVYATATNLKEKQSPQSDVISFFVEYPMPAPTLIDPVIDSQTTAYRPWITGLAVNGSLVKVYIDGVLNGQFTVTDHPSGTASFSYRTLYDLTPGKHTVFTIAEDANNKESLASNVIELVIAQPKAASENQAEVKGEEAVQPEGTSQEPEEQESAPSEELTEENENMNEETEATTEEKSNWPIVVLFMVIAIVLIITIDNLIRRSRRSKSDISSSPPATPSEKKPESESKSVTPDELFPPPPPDLK